MSTLPVQLKDVLRLFVQASYDDDFFDFISLKEGLEVSKRTIIDLLTPQTIQTKLKDVYVDSGEKYRGNKFNHFWDDIEMTIKDVLAIHFPKDYSTPISEIIPPYSVKVVWFTNLIITPIINEFRKSTPKQVFASIKENFFIFEEIDKYINKVKVSTKHEDILLAKHTLNKLALQIKIPKKEKRVYRKGWYNEINRYIV